MLVPLYQIYEGKLDIVGIRDSDTGEEVFLSDRFTRINYQKTFVPKIKFSGEVNDRWLVESGLRSNKRFDFYMVETTKKKLYYVYPTETDLWKMVAFNVESNMGTTLNLFMSVRYNSEELLKFMDRYQIIFEPTLTREK